MIKGIINSIKKAGAYLFIAGATIALPLASELSGFSRAHGKHGNELVRESLVYYTPRGGGSRQDIQRNLGYIDQNTELRGAFATLGTSALAGFVGFSGACGAVLLKRRLDELDKQSV